MIQVLQAAPYLDNLVLVFYKFDWSPLLIAPSLNFDALGFASVWTSCYAFEWIWMRIFFRRRICQHVSKVVQWMIKNHLYMNVTLHTDRLLSPCLCPQILHGRVLILSTIVDGAFRASQFRMKELHATHIIPLEWDRYREFTIHLLFALSNLLTSSWSKMIRSQ